MGFLIERHSMPRRCSRECRSESAKELDENTSYGTTAARPWITTVLLGASYACSHARLRKSLSAFGELAAEEGAGGERADGFAVR